MLECWKEDIEDRPTFAELREKFEALILAGKEGLYIDLKVDETKPYYVIKDEEEEEKHLRLRAASSSSESSTESTEKVKQETVEPTTSRCSSMRCPAGQETEVPTQHPEKTNNQEEGSGISMNTPASKHNSQLLPSDVPVEYTEVL